MLIFTQIILVMASSKSYRAKPFVECDDEEQTSSSGHYQIGSSFRSVEGGESSWNDTDGKHQLVDHAAVNEKSDATPFQSDFHLYPMSREELFKRCQWFDDIEEPVGANAALPPSQSNRLKLSPKQIYHRVKSRRQKSPAPIRGLMVEECEFDFALNDPLRRAKPIKLWPKSAFHPDAFHQT